MKRKNSHATIISMRRTFNKNKPVRLWYYISFHLVFCWNMAQRTPCITRQNSVQSSSKVYFKDKIIIIKFFFIQDRLFSSHVNSSHRSCYQRRFCVGSPNSAFNSPFGYGSQVCDIRPLDDRKSNGKIILNNRPKCLKFDLTIFIWNIYTSSIFSLLWKTDL